MMLAYHELAREAQPAMTITDKSSLVAIANALRRDRLLEEIILMLASIQDLDGALQSPITGEALKFEKGRVSIRT